MFDITYETENTILLIKSIGINYPILREWGFELTKPLFWVVDRGQLHTAVKLFGNGKTPVLNEFMKTKDCKKIFSDVNSAFVLFPYSQSKRGQDFLAFLSCVARIGAVEETPINAMPLIISEGIPYDCDLENFFSVFIDENLEEMHVDEMMAVPPDRMLTVVEDKINSFITRELPQDVNTFLAAACFLYPNIMNTGDKKRFDDIIRCAGQLAKKNEDNQFTSGLSDIFLQELQHWQEQSTFHNVFELPNLEMSTEERLDKVILFDKQYFYISERLFKEIANPLIKVVAIDVLKKTLKQEGILCPENTRTFTVKMGYYNLVAEYKRKRMLRFSRDKLDHVGELDFFGKE